MSLPPPSPSGAYVAGAALFSGVACFGFKTLKSALDGQRILIETDTSDTIDDIELLRGVHTVQSFDSNGNPIDDEPIEVETFFAITSVTKAGLIMISNRAKQVKGYAGLFYVISLDPKHQLRTTISQNAHRAATVCVTPQLHQVWTEIKNRWGPTDPAKYTLEEIKRIYRAHVVGEARAQA